ENYRSWTSGLFGIAVLDTQHFSVALSSSMVTGSFAASGPAAPAAFTKIFWVDSATIFGMQGPTVYRSTDRGSTWRGFSASPKGFKLNDLFFLSLKEGWP